MISCFEISLKVHYNRNGEILLLMGRITETRSEVFIVTMVMAYIAEETNIMMVVGKRS